jgi:hypothetical protein
MIDRVYWIGAGASVPYGFPAMKRLTWELSQTLGIAEKEKYSRAIHECFGQPLQETNSPDFEEFLNRLDPRATLYLGDLDLRGAGSLRADALEIALSGLRKYIREKCAHVASEQGPFDVLVQSLTDNAVLVSFNWDVLAELAFLRVHRPFTYLSSARHRDAIALLKPHGSINWFALLDREMLWIDTATSNLDVLGESINTYMLYVTAPLDDINFGTSFVTVKNALSKVPAIVPPLASKLLSVGGVPRDGFVERGHERVMKSIWSTVVTALDEAAEVIFIGYSLPGTDAASIAVLKHAVGRAKRPKRFLLIDPDPNVAERYRSVLNTRVDVLCPDFRHFDPCLI